MRLFATLLASFIGFLLLSGPALAQGKNVVLIIADDLGMDMGCYGNKIIKTPNLDKLAKNGIRFTNAYATVASCSASRASIFTGMYTHQNGQFGHAHAENDQDTHDWVQGLPLLLRRVGYFTGLVGKYHVQPNDVYGFDELLTRNTGGNRDPIAMNKLARQFIGKAGKRPFFLVYASSDPHRGGKAFSNERFTKAKGEVRYDPNEVKVPYYLPDQPEVRKEIAEYYQAASRFDRGIGMLLEILEETGNLNNTLIIVISDNGIPFPGAKTTLYEPGVHLPMIISAPGHKQNHVNHAICCYIDLAPTILDWANAKGPKGGKRPGRSLFGKSLLPILDEANPKGWDTAFGSHQFHEVTMYYPMRFIRKGNYKLIVNFGHKLDYPFASDLWASPTWQGVIRRKDKKMGVKDVHAYLHRPLFELFDLEKDPRELKNLAYNKQYAEVREDLVQRIKAWQRQTRDPWHTLWTREMSITMKK